MQTAQFVHRAGKTYFQTDSFEKLVLEGTLTPTSATADQNVTVHVESMWLDEPMDIEIPHEALADRHSFSKYVGENTQLMIRFLGSRSQFEAFVAEELGIL